jgi:hypothetical protein
LKLSKPQTVAQMAAAGINGRRDMDDGGIK